MMLWILKEKINEYFTHLSFKLQLKNHFLLCNQEYNLNFMRNSFNVFALRTDVSYFISPSLLSPKLTIS